MLLAFASVVLAAAGQAPAAPPAPPSPVPLMDVTQKLVEIATTLARIEAKIEAPSLWEKVRDDFISNTLWNWLGFEQTGSGVGAKIAAVVGFLFLCARIYFFFADRRAPASGHRGLRRFVDVGLFLYVFAAVMLFGLVLVSGGFIGESQAPSGELRRLRADLAALQASVNELKALPQAELLKELGPLTAEIRQLNSASTGLLGSIREQGDRVTASVGATHRHTAAFWLQVIELFLLVMCVLGLLYLALERGGAA